MNKKNLDLKLIGAWTIITCVWLLIRMVRISIFLEENITPGLNSTEILFNYVMALAEVFAIFVAVYGAIELVRIKKSGLIILRVISIIYLFASIIPWFSFLRKTFVKQLSMWMIIEWSWFIILPIVIMIYLFSKKVSERF